MSDYLRKNLAVGLCCLLLGVTIVIGGCDGRRGDGGDPKKQLSEYISKSFAVRGPEDRNGLLTYLTGESKNRLSAWSDEQFRQAFIDSKRQLLKLLVKEFKQTSPQEVNITYELTYLDQGRGHNAKVTNKKLCFMNLEGGRWLIRDVRNIKELVEYQNEMSLP